jgi:hypothetical protein
VRPDPLTGNRSLVLATSRASITVISVVAMARSDAAT